MNSKWTVISFQHSNNEVGYTWTHSAVHVTNDLDEQRLAGLTEWAVERDIWFRSGSQLFLCATEAQQEVVEKALEAKKFKFDVELSDLTTEDKQAIQRSQVSRRDKIADLLDAPRLATVGDIEELNVRLRRLERG